LIRNLFVRIIGVFLAVVGDTGGYIDAAFHDWIEAWRPYDRVDRRSNPVQHHAHVIAG
jgi:hypothetical protein